MGAEDRGVGVRFDNGAMKVTRTRVLGGRKSALTVGELPSCAIKERRPRNCRNADASDFLDLALVIQKEARYIYCLYIVYQSVAVV